MTRLTQAFLDSAEIELHKEDWSRIHQYSTELIDAQVAKHAP
ncbi:MAG: hypothetical protein RBJ76_13215 [Stenomitos frigidus ULC029]